MNQAEERVRLVVQSLSAAACAARRRYLALPTLRYDESTESSWKAFWNVDVERERVLVRIDFFQSGRALAHYADGRQEIWRFDGGQTKLTKLLARLSKLDLGEAAIRLLLGGKDDA